MEWLKELLFGSYITKIDELERQKEISKTRIIDLKELNDNINKENLNYGIKIIKLEEDIYEFESMRDSVPHDIDDYSISDFFKIRPEKYKFKKKKEYLHISLNKLSKDIEYQTKYMELLFNLGLKTSYKNEDDLVYNIKRLIDNFVNDDDSYDTDLESFGKREWWLNPQEAFDYYETNEGDCEDKSALLWGAIVSALIYFGYEHYIWRLKRLDMTRPIGHAIIVWLKRDLNWKRVESTYYPKDTYYFWFKDTDVFKGEYMKTMHIFDEVTEYQLK